MQQKYKHAEKEQRSVQILDNSEKGLGLEQMSFEHLFEMEVYIHSDWRVGYSITLGCKSLITNRFICSIGVWRGVREKDLVL